MIFKFSLAKLKIMIPLTVFGTEEIVVLFYIAVVFFLQVALLRWVFKINDRVLNQQAIIWLLIKLCEKSGVEKEELDNIKKVFKIK
jgi:hypothetical protein